MPKSALWSTPGSVFTNPPKYRASFTSFPLPGNRWPVSRQSHIQIYWLLCTWGGFVNTPPGTYWLVRWLLCVRTVYTDFLSESMCTAKVLKCMGGTVLETLERVPFLTTPMTSTLITLQSQTPQIITLCHPGLTYIFNFWDSGTVALSPERQSARMSEIKNGRLGLYAKV